MTIHYHALAFWILVVVALIRYYSPKGPVRDVCCCIFEGIADFIFSVAGIWYVTIYRKPPDWLPCSSFSSLIGWMVGFLSVGLLAYFVAVVAFYTILW